MAKKWGRGKSKTASVRKKKKARKGKEYPNSDEEKMVDLGSSSGASNATNDDTKLIHTDTKMLDFDDTRYNMTYITLKMTLDSNANVIEELQEKY